MGGGGLRASKQRERDIRFKAQTSVSLLYFPQTHDLLKDLALSACGVQPPETEE